MFECNVCSKTFQYKNNMYRHRKSHKEIEEYKLPSSYICEYCGVEEHTKKIFIEHIKSHLNLKQSNNHVYGSRLKCPVPNCGEHLKRYKYLDEHLICKHKIDVLEEYLEFENEGEFYSWKSKVEKETQTQYYTEHVRKRKNCLQREYICHRSYKATQKSTTRKRAYKSLGTNKIGVACPSRMIAKFSAKKVEVNVVRKHVGHSNEVIRMRIPSHERAEIASKLKNGVTIQGVLADIRNSANLDHFERLHYIQRRDIWNIIRDKNIRYLTRLHKDDVTSVELLVAKLRQEEDSPILHYNPDSENFSLIIMSPYQKLMLLEHHAKICVDSTQGLNSYGYQLVTILVTDEYNNGIPVAFNFTKKTDLAAVSLFYSKVKEKIGSEFNIQCKVFMSDDAPQFYEAWVNVMGKPDHKLLCWWHVNKNWKKQLNNKIRDNVKRKYVMHTLRTVATVIDDQNDFETSFAKFLDDLCADPDTVPFYDYLQSHYVSKKTSWAFCYRQHVGLNTNMHLEAFHKQIKYTYSDGKQCPRLDKAINALFCYIRDSMFEHVIKLAKNRPCDKLLKIRNAHMKGVAITEEDVECVNESEWRVKSQSSKDSLIYKVKRKPDPSCDSCFLNCVECKICIHTFECSCVDSTVYLNICKHMHKIAEKINENFAEKPDYGVQVHQTLNLLETTPKIALSDEKENTHEIAATELRAKLQLLLQSVDTLSEDEIKFLSKFTDQAISKIKF